MTNKFFDSAASLNLKENVIERSQYIPDSFFDEIREARHEAVNKPSGNFVHAARIPVFIHEKWLREGYDCTKEPIRKTLAKLAAEDMGKLIVTPKSL
jgi:hypothetical protein